MWHGEHVTLYGYGQTEADACGGSFAELDGHTEQVKRDLGIEEAPAYTYRWLSARQRAGRPRLQVLRVPPPPRAAARDR